MPNLLNVASPIVLVSPGRSGTTLLSAVFDNHPDCSSCGETVDLIFDLWNAGQRSLAHITPTLGELSLAPSDDRVAAFVRGGFLSLLYDEKPYWIQKPIGIPASFSPHLFDVESWDVCAEKYWAVMRHTFPQARFFTVLRHPCDTVISYKARFDTDEKTSWASLGFLAHILHHSNSLVGHAVWFDDLVNDREASLRALLTYVGLPFDKNMLGAFDTLHTQSPSRKSSNTSEFSWLGRWAELDQRFAEARFLQPIRALHQKFGRELDMDGAGGRNSPAADTATDHSGVVESELDVMGRYIAQLETRAASQDALWEERAIRVENEFNEAYLRLEAEMLELTALRRNLAVRLMKKAGWLKRPGNK